MLDLIRILQKELSDWYLPGVWFEKRESEFGGRKQEVLFLGYGTIKVPHPTIDTELRVYRVLYNREIGDLLNKPFDQVGYTTLEGTWKAARKAHFDIAPETADPTNPMEFEFLEYDTDAYFGADESIRLLPEEVADFIRSLKDSPLRERLLDFDSKELPSGSIERTASGWDVTLKIVEEKQLREEKWTIDDSLTLPNDNGVLRLPRKEHHDIIADLYVLQSLRNNDTETATAMREQRADLRAGQKINDKDFSNYASIITFSDCLHSEWRNLPEYQFWLFDVDLKLPSAIATDEKFLTSIAKYAKMRNYDWWFLEERVEAMTTCVKLDSSDKPYFAKQINIAKVPSSDYELDRAKNLRELGFDVPLPVGLAVIRGAPYIMFEYVENAINLLGTDSSYLPLKDLSTKMHEQEEQVYTALGQYVRKMFDSGVSDQDMAKRNFMIQFNDNGTFQKVFQVDFEKTTIQDKRLTKKQRRTPLNKLTRELSESERNYFMVGYEIV